ncbi:PadR family transcriptional regulator [Agreia bicolorata]|uniref:PadR family transcriptional regulator n=1 Tax=Agreia bicolorata TaxID=110935 RepID=A0ABR5CCD4_9MICO|nr:PadR family transcriptional regulator [Agreia bicolorata]KJC63289.1 PadR family transcriptional regulator [Agreia bicolorata]
MDSTLTMLGLLGRSPSHGYDLKSAYDRLFAAARPIAYGQVYSALSRLTRDDFAVLTAEEAGQGPDRKRYEITDKGRDRLRSWLFTPDAPVPGLQSNVYAKTMISLVLGDDAVHLLEIQKSEHLDKMRDITRRKRDADVATLLLCDHALFHIEADLRFIDLTMSRLTELKREALS